MLFISVAGCTDRKAEVEQAMQEYDRLIFKMDSDSIPLCFVPDGVLTGKGMPRAQGRDSIRRFLKSFENLGIEMISNRSKSESIEFRQDTAVQKGSYRQVARVAKGDSGVYVGKYEAHWVKGEEGRWLMVSMYTWPDVKR